MGTASARGLPPRALVAGLVALGLSGCATVSEPPPDVLLFTACTLRPDHVGTYGYGEDTTPLLDRLAVRGVVFEEVLTAAPWTRPSVAAMITGRHPRSLGIDNRLDAGIPPEETTLAEHLQAAGYYTIGVTANPNTNRSFGFAQGYDVYEDTVRLWGEGYARDKLTAEDVVETFLTRLRFAPVDQPLFAHLVVVDVHGPYLRETARHVGVELPARSQVQAYDRQVRYVDRVFGDLVATLSERRQRAPLVMFDADHGEGLGSVRRGHGRELYDDTVWVPLVVLGPGVMPGRVKERVHTVDLVPTVLDLLGLDVPDDLPGRSLTPALHGEPVQALAEGFVETRMRTADKSALVAGDHKLILDWGVDPPAALLYDRAEDPRELRSVVREEPFLAARYRSRLVAWRDQHPEPRPAARQSPVLHPQEVRALRALGYVQ
ncbi:MAG: sulfatase [Deltaproteobacteria bacterium]|nr:sulfatase [Deltaproteobacteria bacterium]